MFKCCTCKETMETVDEAREHMIPDKSKNYTQHHVEPTSCCVLCHGCK